MGEIHAAAFRVLSLVQGKEARAAVSILPICALSSSFGPVKMESQ